MLTTALPQGGLRSHLNRSEPIFYLCGLASSLGFASPCLCCARVLYRHQHLLAVFEFVDQALIKLCLLGLCHGRQKRLSHDLAQLAAEHRVILVDVSNDEALCGENDLGMVIEVELGTQYWY